LVPVAVARSARRAFSIALVAVVACAPTVARGDAGPVRPATGSAFVCSLRAGQTQLPVTARRGLLEHLVQYPAVARATPVQRAASRRLLDRLEQAARRWASPAAARRAGFSTTTARRRPGDALAHYLHAEYRHEREGARTLDPTRPKSLIYANERGRPLVLVGVMFAMQRGGRGSSPGGPITRWHSHLVCVRGDRRGRKPLADGTCANGSTLRQGSEMIHVWFTRDLRSAFSISAPERELCRDGLLRGRTCRNPRTGRGM
jgi:hypothetical protein